MTIKVKALIGIMSVSMLLLQTSCSREYAQYENMEVVENSYTGTIDITSVGADPAGDFYGDGESGTYSFAWENSENIASVNFDVTTDSGSVNMVVNDARGDVVLNETLPGDDDTFAGLTEEGRKGTWLITITLSSFDGDGSFSIHSGN